MRSKLKLGIKKKKRKMSKIEKKKRVELISRPIILTVKLLLSFSYLFRFELHVFACARRFWSKTAFGLRYVLYKIYTLRVHNFIIHNCNVTNNRVLNGLLLLRSEVGSLIFVSGSFSSCVREVTIIFARFTT